VRRTLIVGFDGADPRRLFSAAERGDLPHLARLLAGRDVGWGPLTSTLPPMTLPAWASFLTGAPPDDHGIFDFAAADPRSRRLRFVDARDRGLPTIPARLSAAGLKVGLFFFPSTWPPEPLSGGTAAGFDSPLATRIPPEAFHPRSLHTRARRWVGRDLAYADFSELRKGPSWELDAAAALLAGIEAKERFATELLREDGPYDLFGVLFGESDTASHHFWHLADPRSPRFDPARAEASGDVIDAVQRRLDAALGALTRAGGFERVIVASDHGFGGASDRVLHLNAYLADAGLLAFRAPRGGGLRGSVAARLPAAWAAAVARRAPRRVLERVEWRARHGHIDFDATTAWSEELDYAPSVRLTGPDREGTTRRVEEALARWRDPIDGGPVVARVHRRESLYRGAFAGRCPDLLIELRRPGGYSYVVAPSGPRDPAFRRGRRDELRGAKGRGMSGSHRRDGVWVASGCGLAGAGVRREIAELLPAALPDAPRVTAPPVVDVEAPSSGALRRRLRSLGYLA